MEEMEVEENLGPDYLVYGAGKPDITLLSGKSEVFKVEVFKWSAGISGRQTSADQRQLQLLWSLYWLG